MKIFINSLITILFCAVFSSCEIGPTMYTEKDGLYFGTSDTLHSYSFAKYPKRVTDTLYIPVNVMGDEAVIDRPIAYEIIKESGQNSAVEGTHFKVLGQPVIPAGAITGTLPIVIYRTPDLEEEGTVLNFSIRLKTDDGFPIEGIAVRQKMSFSLAYLQRPTSWGEFTGGVTGFFAGYKDNFGTWTPEKYRVIINALYDPETETTVTEFPGSRFQPSIIYRQYVAIVRNYIKANYPGNYGLPGAVLLDPDEDNKPIQVGPANY